MAAVAAEGAQPLPAQAASPLLSRSEQQRGAFGWRGAQTRPAARPVWVGSHPRRHLRLAGRRKKTFTFCSTDTRCDSCDLLFVTRLSLVVGTEKEEGQSVGVRCKRRCCYCCLSVGFPSPDPACFFPLVVFLLLLGEGVDLAVRQLDVHVEP